jgi:hypothetical protein
VLSVLKRYALVWSICDRKNQRWSGSWRKIQMSLMAISSSRSRNDEVTRP